jgi:flavin reductase (DIM6/NTAB) family NADH-FMN oxidoreductase RutF
VTDLGAPTPGFCSPQDFRALMADFPSGVSVVTTLDDQGRPWGMTCSALCSLSPTPPTLLVCLRAESPTLGAIERRGAFVVNFLHGGARPAAELFSSPTAVPERFASVNWSAGASGPHLNEDAHAIADCRVASATDAGSHIVLFGRILDVSWRPGHPPLLYGRRQYRSWPQ